jgi:hypothetical protein
MIQDDSRDWSDFTADFILASMLAFPVLGGIAGYGFRGPVTAGICAIVGSLVWYFMVRLMSVLSTMIEERPKYTEADREEVLQEMSRSTDNVESAPRLEPRARGSSCHAEGQHLPQRCCSGPSVVHHALKNERRTLPALIVPEPVQEPLSQIELLNLDQSVRFAIVSPFGHPFRCPWRPDGLFVL